MFDSNNLPLRPNEWIDQVLQATFHMNYFEVILAFVDYVSNAFSFMDKFAPKSPSSSSHVDGHNVEASLSHEGPFTLWYKMQALYIVWGWTSFICPIAALTPLLFNDGGEFYNQCYYMFYNGVQWYNAPTPYNFGSKA